MVYGVVRMINFAHGEVYMVGAFVGWMIVNANWFNLQQNTTWWGMILMVLAAMLICMTLGILIERLAYKPVRKAPRLIALITAIGMSFLLQNLALLIFSAEPKTVALSWKP
jgi:branched-chain amino acid transport system permease protein